MKAALKEEFSKIRQGLDEHLNGINENSSEIQALFDFLQELEIKVEKVSARLDQIQLEKEQECKKTIMPLNNEEKQIFLVLYTEEVALSYRDIADKANIPVTLVPDYISTLTRKGVPISRSFFENQMFITLDANFKERQAKENVINLSLDSFF